MGASVVESTSSTSEVNKQSLEPMIEAYINGLARWFSLAFTRVTPIFSRILPSFYSASSDLYSDSVDLYSDSSDLYSDSSNFHLR